MSRQWILSYCQFLMSRARPWATEGSKEREESKAGAPRGFGPSTTLCSRRYIPSPSACAQKPARDKGKPRQWQRKPSWGGLCRSYYKAYNGERQAVGKTKGERLIRRSRIRRSLGSKLPRQESWLWILQRGYCVSNQAEIGNM